MDFQEYQDRAARTDQTPRATNLNCDPRIPLRHEVIPLLGLVGEVGGLLAEYKKLLRDGAIHRKFKDEVAEQLGDILWYVANVAEKFDLSLDEIARANLIKVDDRYSSDTSVPRLYDQDCPVEQQLPRRFEFCFNERHVDGRTKLVLVDQLDETDTGDPLTDNAHEDDGYRFHDVLHLAFAACLGWSPVLRKLLRTKGKILNRSPSTFADAEDGGRAQVVEEAIVAAAYVYASSHDFLDGAHAVDWQLLRHIKQMTSLLEVKDRSTGEWNATLLCGFSVWRDIRSHRSGIVRGDLERRTLEVTRIAVL